MLHCWRVAVAASLAAGCVLAQSAQPAQAPRTADELRAAAVAFAADPLVAGGQVGANVTRSLADLGYDVERQCATWQVGDTGFAAVHRPTGVVLAFDAPTAPRAADGQPLATDAVLAAARAFVRGRASSLFADGAELVETQSPGRPGALRVRFERVRQGFVQTDRAEVEVRVASGLISRWRRWLGNDVEDSKPILGIDRAKAVIEEATAKVGAEHVAQWLEVRATVSPRMSRGAMVNSRVYELRAELQSLTLLDKSRLGRHGQWRIDAETGDILLAEVARFTPATYSWYVAHGGTHRAPWLVEPPSTRLADEDPLPSPDSRLVAFSTNRERVGARLPDFPDRWVAVVDGASGEARYAGHLYSRRAKPSWSPDSKRLLGRDLAGLCVYDVASRRTTPIDEPPSADEVSGVWLPDGRVALARSECLVVRGPAAGSQRVEIPYPVPAVRAPLLVAEPAGGLRLIGVSDSGTTLWRMANLASRPWQRVATGLPAMPLVPWSADAARCAAGVVSLTDGQLLDPPRRRLAWPAEQCYPWVAYPVLPQPCGAQSVFVAVDVAVPLPGPTALVLWLLPAGSDTPRRLTAFDRPIGE